MLWWFLAVAGVGTTALFLSSAFRWGRWSGFVVAVGIVFTMAVVFEAARPVTLGRQYWFDRTPIQESILFVLMLSGMAARVLSVAIERSRGTAENSALLHVNKWDFVYPMLFAIPTFGALLGQVSDAHLTLSTSILAFQTGFFWQTILRTVETKNRAADTSLSP